MIEPKGKIKKVDRVSIANKTLYQVVIISKRSQLVVAACRPTSKRLAFMLEDKLIDNLTSDFMTDITEIDAR
jgi:hypothetical protein